MKSPAAYVLDCSMTLAWFFEDEATAETDKLFQALPQAAVTVPALWHLELANSLNVAIKRKRTDENRITQFVARLLQQRILTDHASSERAIAHLRPLAIKHELSVYDAAYLDLAIRSGLPLATLDSALQKAAKSASVALVLKP